MCESDLEWHRVGLSGLSFVNDKEKVIYHSSSGILSTEAEGNWVEGEEAIDKFSSQ